MRQTWSAYYQPTTLAEALDLLSRHGAVARIVAGGTDVMVELSRGVKRTETLIDISRIAELRGIRVDDETITLDALTTHNDVISSDACVQDALPLAQSCSEIGAPQLRTRATVAGNLCTASPANDTISALIALDADLVLSSVAGERIVPISTFYTGFRSTLLRPDELIREIRIPRLTSTRRGMFVKLGLRRAQAISVIHVAIVLGFERDGDGDRVIDARVALGCLAPTVVRGQRIEAFLMGKILTSEVCAEAGRIACDDASPIGDVRGSAEYRLQALARVIPHALGQIAAGRECADWLDAPILLDSKTTSGIDTELDAYAGEIADGHQRRGEDV